VQQYNVTVRSFPDNLIAKAFGYHPKPNFGVENEAVLVNPPMVDFPAPASSPSSGALPAATAPAMTPPATPATTPPAAPAH
jgi:hypothetical protein